MFDNVTHVHIVGAGGIGMSAIGKWFLARGVAVTGSDAKRSAITDDLVARGATVTIGHDAGNVPPECDLLVYTEAAGEENPERGAATARGIRQLGHFDFLGELSKTMRTLCITGTNGKSTTTAMTGKIFEDAGMDPTVFVGSLVPGWELGNLRIGKSDILIVEGDEYKQKMLKLTPEVTVITNIEADHLDVYRDLAHIVATFQQLVDKTTRLVIVNGEDANAQRITAAHRQAFVATRDVPLRIPGGFNYANAAAAMAAAKAFGISETAARESLAGFTGIWRRFERVGTMNGADVISDYGHHPTAIRGTLAAAKEFFPGRRIVLCFQPHQHNRTKELFDDFAASFADADVLVLAEIYGVEGRKEDASDVTSRQLLDAVAAPSEKYYAADGAAAEARLRSLVQQHDVVIVMGAGDIDAAARKFVQ